jgi:hypothetical protein
MTKPLQILSLGAGTQSTFISLASERGDLGDYGPRITLFLLIRGMSQNKFTAIFQD